MDYRPHRMFRPFNAPITEPFVIAVVPDDQMYGSLGTALCAGPINREYYQEISPEVVSKR